MKIKSILIIFQGFAFAKHLKKIEWEINKIRKIKKEKYKYLVITAGVRVGVDSHIIISMEFSVIFPVKSHKR